MAFVGSSSELCFPNDSFVDSFDNSRVPVRMDTVSPHETWMASSDNSDGPWSSVEGVN